MLDKIKYTYDYDKRADVLYITTVPPVPSEGEENNNGIEIDYSIKDGNPCGIKLIGYKKLGWERKSEDIINCVSTNLNTTKKYASSMVQKINKEINNVGI